MKVKLQFKAINDRVEDGKVVSSEEVNDALQITDFDGVRIAVTDFGKNLANALIMQQLPDAVKANNNNTVYLAINGEFSNWNLPGGVAHTFINIREFMTPSVSSSVHGAGWLSCGGHDNDWASI